MAVSKLKTYKKKEFNNGQPPSVDKSFLEGSENATELLGLQEPIKQLIDKSNVIIEEFQDVDSGINDRIDKIIDGTTYVKNATNSIKANNTTNIIPDEVGRVNPDGHGEPIAGSDSIGFGNNCSTGNWSIVMGNNCKSDGSKAIAIGNEVEATRWGCIAIGSEISSSFYNSVAIGNKVEVKGNRGIAIGSDNDETYDKTVAGTNGIAIGQSAQTVDEESIAIGLKAIAKKNTSGQGIASVAIGTEAITTGNSCISIGRNSLVEGNTGIAIGAECVVRQYNSTGSIGIGLHAKLFGDNCIAIGPFASVGYPIQGNIVLANSGIGIGYLAEVTKDEGVAIGVESQAVAEGSIAIGRRAYAGGITAIGDSMALGSNAKAMGIQSTALGYNAETFANDTYVMQLGNQVNLSSLYCRVPLSTRSDTRDKTDIQEISKALEFINKIEPIQYVDNAREKYITDEQRQNDENYKKYGMCNYNIEEHLKGSKKGKRKRVGIKAQQVQQAMQEVYGNSDYGNIVNDNFYDLNQNGEYPSVENKLTVAYSNLIPFLIKAIQEQQSMIDNLKQEVDILKNK